jgi:hypothetical protein
MANHYGARGAGNYRKHSLLTKKFVELQTEKLEIFREIFSPLPVFRIQNI